MQPSAKLIVLVTVAYLAMPTEGRAYNWMAICTNNLHCYTRQCFPPNPTYYELMVWCRGVCGLQAFITDSYESSNCGGSAGARARHPKTPAMK